MPGNTQETRLRLPPSSPNKPRPRFRKKARVEASLRQPNQGPAAPPSQSSEDASDTDVAPAGRRQRPTSGLKGTVAGGSFLRRPSPLVSPATPPSHDQDTEDTAASEAEAGSSAKIQPSKRGWGAYRTSSRGFGRKEEAGPNSRIGTSGTPPKPETLQLEAIAAPTLGHREVGTDRRRGRREGRVSEQVPPSSWPEA